MSNAASMLRYWPALRGRPSGRTVCSNPGSFTVSRTHFSSRYGRPLAMLTRTRSHSFVVTRVLTRAVQCAGRSTGHDDNITLIASVPRVLDHRLPHRHSCA